MRAFVLWSTVLAAAALNAPAMAQSDVSKMLLAEAATEAAKANEAAPAAKPAQAGEAMVAPVRRVAPKTPQLSEPAQDNKKTAVIVPARPNCDAGFKVDDTGKACVAVSSAPAKEKHKAQKASAKKKKR